MKTLIDLMNDVNASIVPSKDTVRIRSKLSVFCDFMTNLSSLSTCLRKKQACVVIPQDFSTVVSIGYNGQPSGLPNDGCEKDLPGGCGCIHAEANAIAKLHTDKSGLILICMSSPCQQCAGLIINSKQFSGVLFKELYRDLTGFYRLMKSGIISVDIDSVLGEEFTSEKE